MMKKMNELKVIYTCTSCHSDNTARWGRPKGRQRIRCKDCKNMFIVDIEGQRSKKTVNKKTAAKGLGKVKEHDDNVLIVGDTHVPFEHSDYLGFCQRIRDKYNCTRIYHIGDLVDNHAISYHEHNPNGLSPVDEYHATLGKLTRWYKAFPEVMVCAGNHDELTSRKAITNGIPDVMIKPFRDIWCFPEAWSYEDHYVWEDILISHGTGFSGRYPHVRAMEAKRMSVVIGHLHSVAGVQWSASEIDCVFGMAVGSGVNRKTYAFGYGKNLRYKPILSCGVIRHTDMGEIHPLIVPMRM